jgi:hypothetical protein
MTAGFRFDTNGEVISDLVEDAGGYIIGANVETLTSRQGRMITEWAKLLSPAQNDLALMKADAFHSGASIVIKSLDTSDLSESTIECVRERFLTIESPQGFNHDDERERKQIFYRESMDGNNNHPELKDHIDIVGRYYTNVMNNGELYAFVLFGAGVTINHIDRCLDAQQEEDVVREYGVEPSQIDWSILLDGTC